jgi:hypothetical protein
VSASHRVAHLILFNFIQLCRERERRRRGNIFSLLFLQTLSMAAGLLIISSQSRVCFFSMDNRQRSGYIIILFQTARLGRQPFGRVCRADCLPALSLPSSSCRRQIGLFAPWEELESRASSSSLPIVAMANFPPNSLSQITFELG